MSDEPIFSVLSGKECCTGNLNISGLPSANGCYVDSGMGFYELFSGEAYASPGEGSSLQIYDTQTDEELYRILYDGGRPDGLHCPITGTHPIEGGGNATIVCGCDP